MVNNISNNNTLSQVQFHCPKCFAERPYRTKPVSVGVSFYYLPLYGKEPKELKSVVECNVCKKGFDPRILSLSNQNFVKLATVAKRQILQGATVEALKEELAYAGLKEEFADKLLKLVLA